MARIRPTITSSSTSSKPRSRPTSLLTMAPEKEPVTFTVNLVGAPPEVEQLVEHIKAVAEQFLYHWKTFPICKPTVYLFWGIFFYYILIIQINSVAVTIGRHI